MKLIRYELENKIYLGFLKDNKIFSFNELKLSKSFNSMLNFIENYKISDIEKIKNYSSKYYTKLDNVKLLSPIKETSNDIICVGLNYLEHAKESDKFLKNKVDNTTYFSKRCIEPKGDKDTLYVNNNYDNSTDYETELGIVIEKKGKNIKEEDVLDHIFGFTIINDFTARELQNKHNQWFKGKGLDGYTSIGPYIVHKSDFKFPLDLNIKTMVNNETRQNSNTKFMIKNINELVSEISKEMTLVPGDLIATGTPEGVGIGFSPAKFLNDGDVVESYIENIGKLTNYISFRY